MAISRSGILAILLTVAVAFPLLGSPWSGSLDTSLSLAQDPANPFQALDSRLDLRYAFSDLHVASRSDFRLFGGYIWQGFLLERGLGAFDIHGSLLFGPSTGDFLYAQEIVTARCAGFELGFYWAFLSEAVQQGPADGFAVRVATSVGKVEIEAITEFGAQIEDPDDDEFNGITIYHAATGLYKHFTTNPVVIRHGFTGQRLAVSGWSLGCVQGISSTLYITCQGFKQIEFGLDGIDVGWNTLTVDVSLTFKTQEKSLQLKPRLNLGDAGCITIHSEVLTDAPFGTDTTNTLFGNYSSITGLGLYGASMSYSWNNVTLRDLTILNTSRYAITTEEYGSHIEEKAKAHQYGHTFYSDYWELISLKISSDSCCGGEGSLLINTYFDAEAGNLFGWGMTHIEASYPISHAIALEGQLKVDDDTPGLDHVGFGMKLCW